MTKPNIHSEARNPQHGGPDYAILACSPRRGGNSDFAAALAEKSLQEAGLAGTLRQVAHLPMRPCVSCGYCDTYPGDCSLSKKAEGLPDQALPLLHELCAARVPLLVSPIYFYHLPAQAKALMDRAQCFWAARPQAKPGQGRIMGAVLLAGRPRGDNLFTGAALSLRYMAEALGLRLQPPLTLYGLDAPHALSADPAAQQAINTYAHKLYALTC